MLIVINNFYTFSLQYYYLSQVHFTTWSAMICLLVAKVFFLLFIIYIFCYAATMLL